MKQKISFKQLANSLTIDQAKKLYDVFDGPVPQEIIDMSVDDLFAELKREF